VNPRPARSALPSRGAFALWITTCVLFGCVPDQADPGRAGSIDRTASQPSGLPPSAPAAQATAAPAPNPQGPTIRLNPGDGQAMVEVLGIEPNDLKALSAAKFTPEQWTALFAVFTESDDAKANADRPAILGTYKVEGELLQFAPRFPLGRGLRYRAVFDPARLPSQANAPGGAAPNVKPIVAEFSIPKPDTGSTTVVTHIYPTSDKLPENLLKFYLHFSAPMSRGEVYDRVHLLKPDGKEVEAPFLNLGEELWDPSGTRLTLLINPGRIKKGLKPREELGPVLEQGKKYTFVIDAAWHDAEGNTLKEGARKTFEAGPADEQMPDPKTWKIAAPAADTKASLVLTFPEPLDRAMLDRVVAVVTGKGEPVPGDIDVEAGETRWLFTPDNPWTAGPYKILIDSNLEDLVGNSIGRAFEVDVFEPIQRQVLSETVTLRFEIQAAAAPK
jgi:hypothetical protein